MNGDELGWWGGAFAAIILLGTVVRKAVQSVRNVSRMADVFLGYDLHGVRIPGMADRMENVEASVDSLTETVDYLTRLVVILAAAQGIDADKVNLPQLLEELEQRNQRTQTRGKHGS